MTHKLRDRCSETLAAGFTASVGNSVDLGGGITDPYTSQTFTTAYDTEAGQTIADLPIGIDEGVLWQHGYATYDHDTNSLEITSIDSSSAGGTAVTFTDAATVSIVILANIPNLAVYRVRPTGANDDVIIREAHADLLSEGGGKLVMMSGEWVMGTGAVLVPMLPGIWTEGEGKGVTKIIMPDTSNVSTLFDFNSSTADQNNWGLSNLTVDGELAAITTRALVSKSNSRSMRGVKLESVAFTGFGKDDTTEVVEEVLALRDPEGLVIHNCDFLDFGNRVGVRVRYKSSLTTGIGASIFTNKFARIKNEALVLDHVHQCRATFNQFSTPDDTSSGLVVYNSHYNNIALNQFTTGLGESIFVKGNSEGNQLMGNVGRSNGETGTAGIKIESTCVDTSITGGSFTGYADDLDDSGINTYVASLTTTAGVIHIPEPAPIPPFTETLLGGTLTTLGTRTFNVADGVVRVTIMVDGFVTAGTDTPRVQLVTDTTGSNVTKTSGYAAISTFFGDAIAVQSGTSTDGFPLYRYGNWSNAVLLRGTMTLNKRDSASDVWIASGHFSAGTDKTILVSGEVDLGGELSQISIVAGQDMASTGTISMIRE